MVSSALRAKAEKLLADAGYIPHGAARSLASRHTRTMGAAIPTVDSAFFARLVDGLQQTIQQQGFQLLLASTNYEPEREASEIRALLERGVDGMLLVGSSRSPYVYELLRSKAVPFVTTCHYDANAPWPCVGWDNVAEAERIARYLVDIGHRRFGIIAGITSDNDRAADRVKGFLRALARRNIRLPASNIIERPYTIADARSALAALLRLPEPPTAVMCGNDILAYGALQECLWQNVRIPDDISITGFDDIDMAAHCRPGITTLHVPAYQVGQRAAAIMLEKSSNALPEHVYVDLELIVRETTAPPHRSRSGGRKIEKMLT
jgi:LacI family transcriptional regulator